MSAVVVGTAYVRIRALTKQLSDDIKKGVDKGIKDAKVNDEGREAGDEFADGFNESSSEGIKAGLKDTFEDDDTDRESEEGGERSGEKWSDGFRNRLNTSMGDTFRTVFRRNRDRDRDIELGGEDDGRTYGDGFRDGLGDGRDGGIFSGLLGGLSRGIGGALRGIGGLLGNLADGGGGGDDGGQSFGKTFAGGFKKGFAGAMAGFSKIAMGLIFNPVFLIGSLIVAITPLLVNGFIALGSMLGTVLAGAIGGGLALGAGLFAGLFALIPLIAAFTAETPLLELFKEEMKLIGEEFMVVAEIVQEQVLPGVLLLAETVVDSLMPAIDDFALAVGDAFGDFTEHLSDLISRADVVERIGRILDGSAEGFRSFLQALIPLTDFALRIFEGLMPLAKTLGDDLNVMFTRWNEWAEGVGASGLTETFQGFYDTFKLVMGGLSDLTVALFNILMIGDSATGQGFFERFREWAREWREFTTSDEGIARYTEMFERAQPVFSEFAGLVADIWRLLFAGATSEGATSGTVGALQWLRQDVIPWFTDTGFPGLKGAIDTVGGIVGGVVTALTPFATAMSDAFSPVVREVIEYLGDRGPEMLDLLTDTLEDLEGPLRRIGEAFAEGLGAFFNTLRVFAETGVLELFLVAMVGVVDIISRLLAIPGMAELIGYLAGLAVIFATISKVIGPVAFAFKILWGALALAVGIFGGATVGLVIAFVVALVAAAVAIIANWDTIVRFFTETLPEAFREFRDDFMAGLEEVSDFFEETWDKFTKGLGDVAGAIVRFVKDIPRKLVSLGSTILRAFVGAITAVVRALPGLFLGIIGAFTDLVLDIAFGILGLGVQMLATFVVAIALVTTWLVTTGIPSIAQFFIDLPGKIVSALATVGEFLLGIFTDAFTATIGFITENIPKVMQFFKDLPGDIWEAIKSIVDTVGNTFRDAWDKAYGFVTTGISNIVSAITGFIGDLPRHATNLFNAMVSFGGKILEGIKSGISGAAGFLTGAIQDITGSVLEGIKNFINNEVIARLEEALSFTIKIGPWQKDISVDLPRFARGGIFDSATAGIMGEAGREVLLPLTNPARTLQLAMDSGLFDVLNKATLQRPSAPVIVGGGRDTGADIERLADRIVAALPEAGDQVQLIMPAGIGRSNAVAVAMESTRQLRSDRWRRGK